MVAKPGDGPCPNLRRGATAFYSYMFDDCVPMLPFPRASQTTHQIARLCKDMFLTWQGGSRMAGVNRNARSNICKPRFKASIPLAAFSCASPDPCATRASSPCPICVCYVACYVALLSRRVTCAGRLKDINNIAACSKQEVGHELVYIRCFI